MVYIGIRERGAAELVFRQAPAGDEQLAADVVAAGAAFQQALLAAVRRGEVEEDRWQGHALARDSATRAIQEHFIVLARRDLPSLRAVLHHSSSGAQRAIAAQLLGYAPDKQYVVEDLVFAMDDPDEGVRNNAMRALLVFAEQDSLRAGARLRVPFEPFIALLNSPVWTDRNKAAGAVLTLSDTRDAVLLAMLRRDAMASLVEMARWKSAGHAMAAFIVVARLAGLSDEEAMDRFNRGDRETVIQAALDRR